MLVLEYEAELARQAWREEGKRDVVKNLLTMNLSLKDIARAVDWTEEDVRKFAEAEKFRERSGRVCLHHWNMTPNWRGRPGMKWVLKKVWKKRVPRWSNVC